MGLYIDSAHIEDVARVCATYPVTGVTTNPSIMRAAFERGQHLNDLAVLNELLQLCEGPVFAQPLGPTEDALYAAACQYINLAPTRIVPKLSITQMGLRVGLRIKRDGGRIAFTAASSLSQVYCAMTAGAEWIIPYFGRLRRAGQDPCERIAQMSRLITQHGAGSRILAASIKSPSDLVEAALAGAHDVTADPAVIESLLVDPITEAVVRQFNMDWLYLQEQMGNPR